MKSIEQFQQRLKQHSEDVNSTIKTMKDNRTASQSSQQPTELSNYDNHPADMGTQLYMVGLNDALMEHQENLLKEIRHALEKTNKGTFGICEICGKDINKDRLEAIPYTRLCLECKEKENQMPGKSKETRSNEDFIQNAPFGRKYLNEREDDEYEGLDILNDLMKYGSSDGPQDMGGYHDYKEFYTNKIDKQGIVDEMDQVSNEEYKKQVE